MRHFRFAVGLATVVCIASPVAAAVTCQGTIAVSFAKFARQEMKLIQRCRELVLFGRATPSRTFTSAASIRCQCRR